MSTQTLISLKEFVGAKSNLRLLAPAVTAVVQLNRWAVGGDSCLLELNKFECLLKKIRDTNVQIIDRWNSQQITQNEQI